MDIHKIVVGSLHTNCYVVVSAQGRSFIIDPGDWVEKIKSFLKKKNCKPEFIVNTHGHFDHIRADKALGLPVYIHEKDAKAVAEPDENPMVSFFGDFNPVKPSRLLKDGDSITLDELVFKVIHTPGHTAGGICLWSPGVLFSGDTLFKDGIGRTDFPGANDMDMKKSLKRLSQLDEKTLVYPGHGPETTIGFEFGSGQERF